MKIPNVSKWLAPSPDGQIRSATPANPITMADTTRRGRRWRRYSQPSSANHNGIIPMRIAAIPDGTVFSPKTTKPLPMPRSRPPTIAESMTCRRVGRWRASGWRSRSQAIRRRPAIANRMAAMRNGGIVSIAIRMPKYVEPQTT